MQSKKWLYLFCVGLIGCFTLIAFLSYKSFHMRFPPPPKKTVHASGTTTWEDAKFNKHAHDELGLPMNVMVYFLETVDKRFARLITYRGDGNASTFHEKIY